MTKARDRVIQYIKEEIEFYRGRGVEQDLTVSVLQRVLMKMETETKW